jgi:hypothetical protein
LAFSKIYVVAVWFHLPDPDLVVETDGQGGDGDGHGAEHFS